MRATRVVHACSARIVCLAQAAKPAPSSLHPGAPLAQNTQRRRSNSALHCAGHWMDFQAAFSLLRMCPPPSSWVLGAQRHLTGACGGATSDVHRACLLTCCMPRLARPATPAARPRQRPAAPPPHNGSGGPPQQRAVIISHHQWLHMQSHETIKAICIEYLVNCCGRTTGTLWEAAGPAEPRQPAGFRPTFVCMQG